MSDETKPEPKPTVVDHTFARMLLGVNGFRREKGTETWRKDVLNLTAGVTIRVEVAPGEDGVLTVTASRPSAPEVKPVTKSDRDHAEIYADAIAWAHKLAG